MSRFFLLMILLLLPMGLTACLNAGVQERVTMLEERIRQSPTDAAAHRELGQTWFDAGHDQKAIDHLGMAVKLDPRHPATWTLLGLAFNRMGQYDQGLRALKAGQRFGAAENDFALGTSYLGVGEVDQGVDHIRQALRKDPSLAEVYQVAVGEKEAQASGDDPVTSDTARKIAMQQALDDILDDFKEQARQDVREQIAEDIILRQP